MESATVVTDRPVAAPESAPAPGRLVSLDALRGFDMIWIVGFAGIIKNLATATGWPWLHWILPQLEHGPWKPEESYGRWAAGFHAYDIIMPLFLFCAGTSMPFSFAKRAATGEGKARIYRHVLTRCAILFVLGMIHQGNLLAFDLGKLHLYCNTLQAIAAGYLIAALLLLNLRAAAQVAVTAALIAIYWALLAFIQVPGQAARGVLTPQANLAIWLDKFLLGRFQDQTYYTWILTSMVFGCTVALGSLAGQWLRTAHAPGRKFWGLLLAGAALTAAGWGWSGVSPIVKYIWSSSFVLYSGGICLLLLAGFYLVVDVWGWRRWTFPLVVVGANAIVAYMIGQFVGFRGVAYQFIGGLEKSCGSWYGVMESALAFGLLWLLLYWMYKKKTFVRV